MDPPSVTLRSGRPLLRPDQLSLRRRLRVQFVQHYGKRMPAKRMLRSSLLMMTAGHLSQGAINVYSCVRFKISFMSFVKMQIQRICKRSPKSTCIFWNEITRPRKAHCAPWGNSYSPCTQLSWIENKLEYWICVDISGVIWCYGRSEPFGAWNKICFLCRSTEHCWCRSVVCILTWSWGTSNMANVVDWVDSKSLQTPWIRGKDGDIVSIAGHNAEVCIPRCVLFRLS